MKVRMLSPADAVAFQALRLRGLQECSTAFASSYEEECETPSDVIAGRLAAGAGRAMFGAFRESSLVGVVGIQRETMPRLKHKAFIWGMYVAPEVRGKGAGRLLVAEALKYAFSMDGVRQVNLGVNALNVPAIALYEGAGFERFGLERGFMLVDGVLQDELQMVRVSEHWPSGPAPAGN